MRGSKWLKYGSAVEGAMLAVEVVLASVVVVGVVVVGLGVVVVVVVVVARSWNCFCFGK